jgi:hypothetical protein
MNFTSETGQIADELKNVDGYLACEKIIIKNIIKQLDDGLDNVSIENYLKELAIHLEYMQQTDKENNIRINYLFAAGFINTLLRNPAWENWVKTIET